MTYWLGFFFGFSLANASWNGLRDHLTYKITNSKDLYLVQYSEEGRFVVDTYFIPADKLQDRIEHRTFTDEKLRSIYIQSRYPKLILKTAKTHEGRTMSESTTDVIWEAVNTWSPEWEQKYSEWVRTEVDEMFFKKHSIKTDCADVAYALKWIFARIHKLPMMSLLAGSNTYFSHESMKASWIKLGTHKHWYRDTRFRVALDYVLGNTYTHTLLRDSYPIKIGSEILVPGTHHLDIYDPVSGHTMIVNEAEKYSGRPYMIFSNVPQDIRILFGEPYFRYSQPTTDSGGFLKIRWAVKSEKGWRLFAAAKMPGYSKEQYEPEFMSGFEHFDEAVRFRLAGAANLNDNFQAMLEAFVSRIAARIQVVEQGYEFCNKNECDYGSSNWDNWSTNVRDQRILNLVQVLVDLGADHPEFRDELKESLNKRKLTTGGISSNYFSVYENFYLGRYSSDPKDPIATRWGF